MKFALADKNGLPAAFYDESIHGKREINGQPNPNTKIPGGAVPISDDDWRAFLGEPGRWLLVDGVRVPAPVAEKTIDEALSEKIKAVAAKRYAVETGGITINGAEIDTDRDSQALLTGAWCYAQQSPGKRVNWKGKNGWANLGKNEISAIAEAVGDHIQACFTKERAHVEALQQIASGVGATVAHIEAYDIDAGWPG
jgi:hypothetical protein